MAVKRLLLALAGGLAVIMLTRGAPLRAQPVGSSQTITVVDSGTACVTAPTACAIFALDNQTAGVTLSVAGTWTGTLTFEGTNNDGIWTSLMATNVATAAQATTTTANGLFTIANVGVIKIRARATAAITGGAIVTAAKGLGFARAGPTGAPGSFQLTDNTAALYWAGRTVLRAPAVGVLTIANIAETSVVQLDVGSQVTAGTDSTSTVPGSVALTRFRYQTTITPATAGVGNCGAAFLAAALTADCTVATLPAGQKLAAVYADVTVGFTCSGTCTGTKVLQAGTAVNGTQVLAASLNVAATATYGLADADLGSGLTRAAAIQGGLVGSWSATTPISVRFTSGTGNWGSGAATFVNAGSVKFTLITEQIK